MIDPETAGSGSSGPIAHRPSPIACATSRRAAFTLIELLVVIAIIVLVAGGLGLALGDTGSNALASAQNTLLSVVSQTRAQAAVNQTRARLYVYGTRPPAGDAEKFLRLLQVFREQPAGSGTFVPAGAATYLPRGVYLVPVTRTGLLAAGVVWSTNPTPESLFASTTPQALRPQQPAGTPFGGAVTAYYLEFAADGTVTPANAKLAAATAGLANNLPQFNNAGAVRGLIIRPSGAVIAANDATSF